MPDTHDTYALSTTRQITQCKALLAGHVGEELLLGSSAYAYTHETQNTLELCKNIACKGVSLENLPKKTQGEFMQQALDLQNKYKQEIRILLEHEKKIIIQIAQELEHKQLLTQAEIAELIRQ